MTVLRSGDMVHCRILANSIDAIVTAGAVVGDAGVIKHPGGKSTGVMAHAAIFRRWDVRGGFARGDRTVMAGCAIADDVLVIEDRGTKRRGGMAKVAILRGRQMVGCCIFAGSVLAIVTTIT